MNILLYGDYSSLHLNLRDGLRKLGHSCCVASDGNSWLKLSPDYLFDSRLPSILGKIDSKIIRPLKFSFHGDNYDVVQYINPLPISPRLLPLIKVIIDRLSSRSKKQYLLAAGDDYYYLKYGIDCMRYSPVADAVKYDQGNPLIWLKNDVANWNINLTSLVDGIIPVAYDYQCGYLKAKIDNLRDVIPMPINISNVRYTPNVVAGKIRIFHGLNRYGFKGTKYVREAFDVIEKRFGKHVECKIEGKMPLAKYLEYIRTFNINIDQTSSYSYGMNALYAMASGQIVLSGAEPECIHSLNLTSTPVVNVTPNPQSIVDAVENLLETRKDFEELGYESRKFVEDNHSHIKVASKFIEEWAR